MTKTIEKKVRLKDKTYWVGYIDDRKVPFHRLILEKGTTYNSYLLDTEKPTIIDTVDISFGKHYIENLKEQINLEDISFIVINHVEPDHSGALPALAARAKNAVIVTSEKAVNELKNMYHLHNREFLIVHDGDTLDIGGKTLQFYETPYLHTEETIITYAVEDKTLYTCDIFSSHVATTELFNDLVEEDIKADFTGYYKLIMAPHRPYVQKMIEKINKLDIEMIAPSHGYILREDVQEYIDIYDQLSRSSRDNKKALVVYSSMGGNTKKITNKLEETLKNNNIKVEAINVTRKLNLEEIKQSIQEADAIFFGSSTRYGDMVGNMEIVLKEIQEMNLEGKITTAFGSYGWSGEAVEIIQDYLNNTNMQVLDSSYIIKTTGMDNYDFPIRVKFQPVGDNKIDDSAQLISDLLKG